MTTFSRRCTKIDETNRYRNRKVIKSSVAYFLDISYGSTYIAGANYLGI